MSVTTTVIWIWVWINIVFFWVPLCWSILASALRKLGVTWEWTKAREMRQSYFYSDPLDDEEEDYVDEEDDAYW